MILRNIYSQCNALNSWDFPFERDVEEVGAVSAAANRQQSGRSSLSNTANMADWGEKLSWEG